MTASSATKNLRLLFLGVAVSIYAGNFILAKAYEEVTASPVPEWTVGFDLIVLVPLLYIFLFRPSFKKSVVAAFALSSAGIFVGSYIIPQQDKEAWLTLEMLRWPYLGALIIAQAAIIISVAIDIKRNWSERNIELAVNRAIAGRVAGHNVVKLLQADARVWLYALVRDPSKFSYTNPAFYSEKHDSNASNQQAFLILVAAEIPIAHILIGLFSPSVALAATSLSIYGFIFLYSEYRATLLRATTFEDDHLHIRQGVLGDLKLPYSMIQSVERVTFRPRRESSTLRFVGTGTANVLLVLRGGSLLPTLFGEKDLTGVYLGLDEPKQFVTELSQRLGT